MMKKGQAAMEFLMTYGWAILVVLIAIGALAYFGVLNPSRFLPESCTIGPGFSCDEFQVLADGSWTIVIRNGIGKSINTIDLDLSAISPGGLGTGACLPVTVAAGSTTTCTGAAGTITAGTAGDMVKATIGWDYTEAGGTLAHTKAGSLATKME